ncbi:ornithine carbamoyltransferase [Crocosphaera sp.]|uniref:ornithine carbamoyltransferase n=1 Tax=Crocosphaera sp. TaxID=2729996 RepID=UPI0026293871|nr:ornithine carbamoyltransferase [Crocosphaera sp.]MDJ0583322.1 ornithine carbamoyltransferase [Crocosphaera sp.]
MMTTLQGRDILGIGDLSAEEMTAVLDLGAELKSGQRSPRCQKILGLLFDKASTRTRVSFSAAIYQLGGQVLDLNPSVTQVGRGEPAKDTARVLDRYLDILAIRTFEQSKLETFAEYAEIPVINALTDLEHPCQILADFMTIKECFGQLEGSTLTYLGDGNNVAHSLILGGALMGMKIRVATPKDYQPLPIIIEQAKKLAEPGFEITITDDPVAAVKHSNVLYTDVWASMGQEDLAQSRIPIFQPYQINDELLSKADSEAIVLHCLPAHRGEEITDSVIEGEQSKVWDQAENRMHAQKALMVSLLGIEN